MCQSISAGMWISEPESSSAVPKLIFATSENLRVGFGLRFLQTKGKVGDAKVTTSNKKNKSEVFDIFFFLLAEGDLGTRMD